MYLQPVSFTKVSLAQLKTNKFKIKQCEGNFARQRNASAHSIKQIPYHASTSESLGLTNRPPLHSPQGHPAAPGHRSLFPEVLWAQNFLSDLGKHRFTLDWKDSGTE